MELADKELIAEFVVESQEGLAKVENQMLAIEAAGANIDGDLVNAVFRTMHSIKGTAGFLGLARIGTLAHGLEEVLNNLRNREVVPTSELVTSVLRAADFMKGLIDAVETSGDADIEPFVAELQQFRPGAETAPSPTATIEPPVAAAAVQLSEAVREFLVECRDNLDQMEHDLVALEAAPESEPLLRNIFRTIHTVKGGAGFLGLSALERLAHVAENLLSKLRDGQRPFNPPTASILLTTVDKCREGLSLVEAQGSDNGFDPQAVVQQLLELEISGAPSPAGAAPAASPASTAPPTPPPASAPAVTAPTAPAKAPVAAAPTADSPDKGHSAPADTTIRVDVALLDKLMTRVGELVLARNQILQHTSNLEDSAFVSTAQRLNLITTELQESVMKTRMQPIGNVWAKFPRVVRDLASQLGKQVRIEMEGKETELDKTIVEAIKDPLTHLVRNSVDHGIETPEKRVAAGKPAEGVLSLRAFHEGGQVNIEINDDGAGLNIERIRRKAVERGLVSADQATRMTDREVSQLIMLPGFSTAEQVTSVSGRGVGMDVVKTNIERIGGMIDLQSRPGSGTTVKIKIPLTLAIIPALVVTSDGDRYAIPQVSLLELVRLEGEQVERGIEYVHGAPVHRLRGKLLPLLYLAEQLDPTKKAAFGTEAAGSCQADQVVNIVVLRANDRQFGLVVDKVNDTEEIVVKPLGRQLKNLGEYAGATIMGDGTVALILDVMGLAVSSGLAGEMRDQTIAGGINSEVKASDESQSLLIVDLGDARRFALPTSMVSRLEKAQSSAVEYADGREVIQYRGAILPLVRLGQVFGASTDGDKQPDELQIVVYAEQGRSYGLVVNRIVDVVDTQLGFDPQARMDDNLLGTTVIQQRVTDVLNLRNLARHAAGARRVFAN
ncbi:MAG: chemotaxis protein CheA [Pirellulaceae bacterium]|nr:chemotaxis protein CheA [Pirellulaceae bacterium]